MMKKSIYLIGILSIFIFSCKKHEYYTEIDSDILIELKESVDGDIQLIAFTEKIYGSLGNQIIYSMKINKKEIKIKFKKINALGFLTALGPATATINLDDLNKDTYKIIFKLNGVTTIAELTTNPLEINIPIGSNVRKK